MPNGDGTGPEGKGPKTGRGQGNCDSSKQAVTENKMGQGFGRGIRGFGRRSGAGRGFGPGAGRRSGTGRGFRRA